MTTDTTTTTTTTTDVTPPSPAAQLAAEMREGTARFVPPVEHDQIVNYTPHAVTLLPRDGEGQGPFTFPSVGVARCTETIEALPPLVWDPFGDSGMVDSARLVKKSFGAPEGLPEPRHMVRYIVSQIVQDAVPDRHDLLVPSEIVRDAAGQIVGCRSFATRQARQ